MIPKFFWDKYNKQCFWTNNYVVKKTNTVGHLISINPIYGNKVSKRLKKDVYEKLKKEKEESIKMNPNRVIKNILKPKRMKRPGMNIFGKDVNLTTKQYKKKYGPKGDVDGDGFPNWKDCRPLDPARDMVRYGYYKSYTEDGNVELVYAGSIKGVRRIGEQRSPPVNYVKIEEITYAQAKEMLGDEGLLAARQRSKGFTSAGHVGGRERFKPRPPE